MVYKFIKYNINDSEQWILIRGRNFDNPVCLFIHGGPGSPLMLFSSAFDNIFLDYFTVVHWDQRLSGKSNYRSALADSFTLDQIALDGLKVIELIKKELKRDKIILIGHSWGTMVASKMIQLDSTSVSHYFSVGTVSNLASTNLLKYEFLKEKVERNGTKDQLKALETLGTPPWRDFSKIAILGELMKEHGGILQSLSFEEMNSAAEKSSEYTKDDFVNLGEGQKVIWNQVSSLFESYNAIEEVPTLPVPTHFCMGQFDMATPTSLAKEYFDEFQSPAGKYWKVFEQSAHYPMYEQAEDFLEYMRECCKS